MIIYHGHPSRPSLEKCRRLAPNVNHGAEVSSKTGRRAYDEPYIVDNGAFAAFKNETEWDPAEFEEMLAWVDDHPRDPDFVVVPDVVGDADATFERSAEWADCIDHPTYQPVQDGMAIAESIAFAQETGSLGIFVGGTRRWKEATASRWIEAAHAAGLKCHVARPWDLYAAMVLGAGLRRHNEYRCVGGVGEAGTLGRANSEPAAAGCLGREDHMTLSDPTQTTALAVVAYPSGSGRTGVLDWSACPLFGRTAGTVQRHQIGHPSSAREERPHGAPI